MLRQDIQALRGLAVLMVVIYHARLGLLPAGYLGVDIFFVISGFLITSMVTKQLEQSRFSFREFYFRRAKRLLPAAYTTFTVTAVLAMFLLTSTEFRQFAQQLAGAVTFTANFVLMRQGSYFGGDADLKPLLHTWSLSIEEQYYLIMPLLLFLVPRRFWLPVVVATLIGSLAACIAVGLWKPQVAFYFFPTRAWELAIGSLGAFLVSRDRLRPALRMAFWPAVAALLILPVFPIGGLHPGIDAFLACSATLVVILRNHPRLNGPAIRPLAFVGDFSYSLYLVHWPLFAFAMNAWLDSPPLAVKLVLIATALVLAWLQYRLVEYPVHKAPITFSRKRIAAALCLSVSVIAVPYAAIALGAAPADYAFARRGNTGMGDACVSDTEFTVDPGCMIGTPPTLLVWGDSYAMHLIPGIVATRGKENVVQATKYVCGPLLNVAPVGHLTGATQNRDWAEGCLDFTQSVIKYLKDTPTIRTVVLSSVFKQYMTASDFHVLVHGIDGDHETPGGPAVALNGTRATVQAIRALGRKVVVVAPPPALDWDAGLCAERRLRGLPTFGPHRSCAIPDGEYRTKRALVLGFLAKLHADPGVDVIMFDDILRRGTEYPTIDNGNIMYIANGHLSYKGSVTLAERMQMGRLIAERAR
ncbi:acyltransferase family protein [Sphingomonas sp.]|uniref:acyltransferase family protein n=1 Tax=Sphingomonas sp. TaxID=28214 RepID=UPI0025FBE226|nr:acyltransferase family protein [Sphingomonas sp.]